MYLLGSGRNPAGDFEKVEEILRCQDRSFAGAIASRERIE